MDSHHSIIADLVAGATDDSLQQALVDWVNLLLAGAFDKDVNTIIYEGRLIALSKKMVEYVRSPWVIP